MIHPSYTDLMAVVNSEVEPGEQPVVNSRYSIVLATAKRARQIIAGDEPLVKAEEGKKPLSIAVQELYEGKIKIMGEDEEGDEEDLELEISELEGNFGAVDEAEIDMETQLTEDAQSEDEEYEQRVCQEQFSVYIVNQQNLSLTALLDT